MPRVQIKFHVSKLFSLREKLIFEVQFFLTLDKFEVDKLQRVREADQSVLGRIQRQIGHFEAAVFRHVQITRDCRRWRQGYDLDN